MVARTLLPTALRTTPRTCAPSRILTRLYHSHEHAEPPPPYEPVESKILSASLKHVPVYGFTVNALSNGARDAGYLDITANLFPNGAMDLIKFHLYTQRVGLKDKVDFQSSNLSTGAKIRELCIKRLQGNEPVIDKWQQALAVMSLPSNVPESLKEMALLVDEIWYLAGDKSVDTSWYTKRGSLGLVYGATEIFMTTDKSPEYRETWRFLDARLREVQDVGSVAKGLGEYASFFANSTINILRSKSILK